MRRHVDKPFLFAIIILVVFGFFIFTSASLGLLAREGARFSSVAFSQIFFGIILGSIALVWFSRIKSSVWKKYAPHIFIASVVLTLLVFVPFFGLEIAGAKRWISIAGYTFQPAEFLKLGFVLFLAYMLSKWRAKLASPRYGLLPFLALLGGIAGLLLSQPDTGTLVVIVLAGGAMYLTAGAPWRDIFILAIVAVLTLGILAYSRPYIADRLLTYANPAIDPAGSSYQIRQALIAVGSGELAGRGFGQSIQKFNHLPEPIGDSIFAVAAEEFGFIGSVALIVLFVFLAFRGLLIAARAPDYFSAWLVVGLVTLIVAQSFINIAAMIGIVPLTGLPLLFVSHGGSAMLIALAQVGIILGVSRYAKRKA